MRQSGAPASRCEAAPLAHSEFRLLSHNPPTRCTIYPRLPRPPHREAQPFEMSGQGGQDAKFFQRGKIQVRTSPPSASPAAF